ncbi:non-reducing end alpha-L-arabinofuranosidase family hydrolase [Streptomyces kroppenstedtii]|jgi:hypothetical protein|uniref:non-reducing end alpha-L-arabinofuranosidase family hydrolase n=1 Tax=Streptomyces kroppenstedtii TaxID=3051181 RepID=UPI0028D6D73F|nr:non-reducing end alpha-L-arabinofuranosidase family hydrolase [Streptomyces sp. DSM 40484]
MREAVKDLITVIHNGKHLVYASDVAGSSHGSTTYCPLANRPDMASVRQTEMSQAAVARTPLYFAPKNV